MLLSVAVLRPTPLLYHCLSLTKFESMIVRWLAGCAVTSVQPVCRMGPWACRMSKHERLCANSNEGRVGFISRGTHHLGISA